MRDGVLKRRETESQMAAGGMSGDAEPLEIEPGHGIVFVFAQRTVGAANVLKCSGPSAAGISEATVFDVPGGDAGLLQCVAKVSGVNEVVFGAPVAAMNKEDEGMRAFASRNANVDELIWVLAVRKAQIGVRRFLFYTVFALHAKQYRAAVRERRCGYCAVTFPRNMR